MPTPDRKAKLAGWLCQLIAQVMADEITPELASGRLHAAADAVAKWSAPQTDETPQAAAVRLEATPREARQIFDLWIAVTDRPRAKWTQKRSGLIRRALRDFSAAQLEHIIRWAVTDDHYSGRNDRDTRYDKLETMFASVERIEALLERSCWTDSTSIPTQAGFCFDRKELKRQHREALRTGDTERADELYQQLSNGPTESPREDRRDGEAAGGGSKKVTLRVVG